MDGLNDGFGGHGNRFSLFLRLYLSRILACIGPALADYLRAVPFPPLHPILYRFSDSFFIGTYGVLIALGLVAGSLLASWLGKRRGYNPDIFFDLVFIAVASGFLGARILYIFTEFDSFLKSPMEFIFSRTGFVFLGGFLAATATCIAYMRWKKLDPWIMSDLLVPALALAHAFGRIGCHLAGCCYGGQCPTAFGIHVPRIVLPGGEYWPNAYADQLDAGLVSDSAHAYSLAIWPVQLMESTGLLILCAALVFLSIKNKPKGTVLGAYLVGYAVLRFTLEFLRGDVARGMFMNDTISTSQIISIFLFVAGVGILIKRTFGNRPAVA